MQSRGIECKSLIGEETFTSILNLEIANSKQQRKLRHIVHSGIEVQTGVAKTGVGILKGGNQDQ
jgi:hypothetical protein